MGYAPMIYFLIKQHNYLLSLIKKSGNNNRSVSVMMGFKGTTAKSALAQVTAMEMADARKTESASASWDSKANSVPVCMSMQNTAKL